MFQTVQMTLICSVIFDAVSTIKKNMIFRSEQGKVNIKYNHSSNKNAFIHRAPDFGGPTIRMAILYYQLIYINITNLINTAIPIIENIHHTQVNIIMTMSPGCLNLHIFQIQH